jgi:hypothetical protein
LAEAALFLRVAAAFLALATRAALGRAAEARPHEHPLQQSIREPVFVPDIASTAADRLSSRRGAIDRASQFLAGEVMR